MINQGISFENYERVDNNEDYGANLAAKMSNTQETELAKLFYSKQNINRLQKKIKKEVFERTRGKYRLTVDQDENDLILLMQEVYSENANHQTRKIVRQTKKLNEDVINCIIPSMITNIQSYYHYLHEVNSPLKPIPLAINVSNAGSRSLHSTFTR